jgi:hypothetical protein
MIYKYYKPFLVLFCFLAWSCEDDDENLNGTGKVNFSLTELIEVENATTPLSVNIGIDNFNHSGGTIDVSISGADYGSDYETSAGSGNFTLEIAPQGLLTLFSIQPVDDEVIEQDKVLTISLSNPTGSIDLGESTTLTFTILDNDDPLIAMVGFENETGQIEENSSNPLTINIPFNQATTDGGTISVSSSGDAVFGTDYTISGQSSGSFIIAVPAGAMAASFDIQTIDNSLFEADRTVTLTIDEVSGGLSLGAQTETAITIINDDLPPNPVIDFNASNTLTYNEDVGAITLNFDLTGTTTADATVELTTSGTADSNDFNFGGSTANPYSFVVPSGSSTASITINVVDDIDLEEDESIILNITSVTGGLDAGLSLQQQTVTILANDAVVFNYVEDFESGADLATLGYENILNGQTVDPTVILSLITNAGAFSDVNDVNGTSDNGLNLFYNAGSGTTVTELLDNIIVSPIMNASGNMEVTIDNSYAFKNQNTATVTFYWSETYNGSGTFTESEWNVMGTETAANMDSEGFGNNVFKRQVFNINPSANFYIAIRVSQTIDATNYRTRWRFDNLKVNSQ